MIINDFAVRNITVLWAFLLVSVVVSDLSQLCGSSKVQKENKNDVEQEEQEDQKYD